MRGPLNEEEPTHLADSFPHRLRMASHSHRILIYTTCYNVLDGVTITIRKLEQEILASGAQLCVLTTKSGDPENTHLDGTHPNRRVVFLDNSVPIAFLRDPNNPDLTYHVGSSLSHRMRSQIEEFEPSLIHITVPDLTAIHLVEYAREKELPLMGTYHSQIPEYLDHYAGVKWLKHFVSGFMRHQYNFLQALYVPTPFIHKHLSDTYKMERVTSLRVWGRGIDLEKFSPRNRCNLFRQKLGISDDEVVVLWVGRLVNEKRPDIFANIIRRLHREGVRYKALVVGCGQAAKEIKELHNTIFLGWLNGSELSVAYASSDVFVFPSAVETFGNVSLEAAASGLPLVVEAGCGGHLVNDGENGFACAADDEDAFYGATRTLVENHEMRASFSKASRELSLGFEKGTVMKRMLDNYSIVTDEFYYDYGGHHKNRDRAYDNEDSFWGGNHPRSATLMLIEVLGFAFMRFLLYVMLFTSWLQKIMMLSRHLRVHDQASMESYRKSVAKSNQDKGPLSPVTEEDLEADQVLTDDDDSTVTSEESASSFSSALSSCSKIEMYPIASWIAIVAVKVILFQFRMESHVRNSYTNCRSFDWNSKRKRKNSSVVVDLVPSTDESDEESVTVPSNLERRLRRSPVPSDL